MLALGVLHWPRDDQAASDAVRPSVLFARHSLVAYVVHLLLLYGTPVTPNLASSFGKSLDIVSAAAVCVLILAATLGMTWLWHWLEREQLLHVHYKQAGLLLFGLVLLVR